MRCVRLLFVFVRMCVRSRVGVCFCLFDLLCVFVLLKCLFACVCMWSFACVCVMCGSLRSYLVAGLLCMVVWVRLCVCVIVCFLIWLMVCDYVCVW